MSTHRGRIGCAEAPAPASLGAPEPVEARIARWLASETGDRAATLQQRRERLDYMADHQFEDFEPACGPGSARFRLRLRQWLDNCPDESDQQALLAMAERLVFVSRDEFRALYLTALNERIDPWLIAQHALRLDAPDIGAHLRKARRATWFGPGTDSMRIDEFCHTTGLGGPKNRVYWKQMATSRTPKEHVVEMMEKDAVDRIVILEDFVGSGMSLRGAVSYAARLPGESRRVCRRLSYVSATATVCAAWAR